MASDPHEEYVNSLPREAKQLVILQSFLYEGSWDEMVRDLEARRDGKPFVYKLQSRIDEDLDRIAKLKQYEKENGVHLGDYVKQYPGERKARSS